jgi:outer membrane protein assembly factor BamB
MNSSRFWSTILAVCVMILCATSNRAQDWTQWRGANRDGNSPSISSQWPRTLTEEWKVTVGVGHSSPVVAKGKIYVFARQGEQETLLCLDAITGKEIWRSSQPVAYEMNPAATGHGKGPNLHRWSAMVAFAPWELAVSSLAMTRSPES